MTTITLHSLNPTATTTTHYNNLLFPCRRHSHTFRRTVTRARAASSVSMAVTRTREELKKGIAELYDESSAVWEDIWGDHMHHGFYDASKTAEISQHRAAQIRMIEEALSFADVSGTSSINLIISNNCPYTIWPGTLTSSGPPLPSTGFELAHGASNTLAAQPSWSGRIWARSQCRTDGQKFVCGSADCGSSQVACNGAGAIPPATLVEFTLNGDGNKDFYDVSLVDGFNLPVSVVPQGCPSTSCPVDINNKACPPELAIKDGSGGVIGCKSACLAFNQPQYCCTGAYSKPETCPPNNYSKIFKAQCPQAYSYAYDDKSSTFTCPSGSTDYRITFCP